MKPFSSFRQKNSYSLVPETCAQVAPFLVALFDGESDELGAKRARRHLLLCPRCADAWRSWSESREALQSLETPAPPRTLERNVINACRLSSPRSHRSVSVSKFSLANLIAFFGRVEPRETPPDLSAQILAQTTRRARPTSISGSRFRLAAITVPSLCAFLLLATRPPALFERETLSSASSNLSAQAEVTSSARSTHTNSLLQPRAIKPLPRVRVVPDRVFVSEAEIAKTPTRNAPQTRIQPAMKPLAVTESWDLNKATTEEKRVLASVNVTPTAGRLEPVPSERMATVMQTKRPGKRLTKNISSVEEISLLSEATLTEMPATSPRARLTRRNLSLEARSPMPRLAMASLDSAAAPTRVARPSTSVARVVTEPIDTGDEGLQEIQTAVEDFRAALTVEEEHTEFETHVSF